MIMPSMTMCGLNMQDVAILAGARLAFVGVAHQVLLAGELSGA